MYTNLARAYGTRGSLVGFCHSQHALRLAMYQSVYQAYSRSAAVSEYAAVSLLYVQPAAAMRSRNTGSRYEMLHLSQEIYERVSMKDKFGGCFVQVWSCILGYV